MNFIQRTIVRSKCRFWIYADKGFEHLLLLIFTEELCKLWGEFLLKFTDVLFCKHRGQEVRSRHPFQRTAPGLRLFPSSCQNHPALKASSYTSVYLLHILPFRCERETGFKLPQNNSTELEHIKHIPPRLQREWDKIQTSSFCDLNCIYSNHAITLFWGEKPYLKSKKTHL